MGCVGFYCGNECLCECFNGQLKEHDLKDFGSRKYHYIILIQNENGTTTINDAHAGSDINADEVDDIINTNYLRLKRQAGPPQPPAAAGPNVGAPPPAPTVGAPAPVVAAPAPVVAAPAPDVAAPPSEPVVGSALLIKKIEAEKLKPLLFIDVKDKFDAWKAKALAIALKLKV